MGSTNPSLNAKMSAASEFGADGRPAATHPRATARAKARAAARAAAESEAASANASDEHALGGARKRGAGVRQKAQRQKSRNALRQLRESAGDALVRHGLPEFDGLKPILSFLAIPAFLVLAITVTGGNWPTAILYPIALILGLIVAISALKGVELVLAILLIYLPFSKVFVVPIAPGVNGTNMLILLGLFAAVLKLKSSGQKITDFPAGAYLVFLFGFLTACSAFTITLVPGGRVYLLYSELLSYKAWIDQFIFYFIALMCIRDTETAKRCIVYVMIGSMLVVLYSVPEMMEKGGRSTIDKSRIGGPHLQSNNFGGFVAYTILPLIALFITYIKDIRAWLLTPYFLLAAKVLISTFSRGAYLAIVVGALLAGWFKGKGFLALWLAAVISFFLVFPVFIPDAIVARMDTLTEDANTAAPTEEKLDKSSATRLILWRAAASMIQEDPIWGKGFKGFPLLKNDYTESPVLESDPHSMYLYIGSQMGIPALSLFIVILVYSFWLGRQLSQHKTDKFIRVIGIGGASATACLAIVCIFGSRAVSLNFTVYFWTFLVAMQAIRLQEKNALVAANPKRRRVTAVDIAQSGTDQADHGVEPLAASFDRVNGHATGDQLALDGPQGLRPIRQSKKNRSAKRGAAAYQASQADLAAQMSAVDKSVIPSDTPSSATEQLAFKPRTRAMKARRNR